MTNTEIMLCDAEYWFGSIRGGELTKFYGDGVIARIAYLDSEYGCKRDVNNDLMNPIDLHHRSWFALLIAAAEDEPPTLREQMDAAWPFPVVHGEIPG